VKTVNSVLSVQMVNVYCVCQKSSPPPRIFSSFLRIGLEFQDKILHTYVVIRYVHISVNSSFFILPHLKIISIAVLPPSDFSTRKNVWTVMQQITSFKPQQQKIRFVQSLRMFKMSVI